MRQCDQRKLVDAYIYLISNKLKNTPFPRHMACGNSGIMPKGSKDKYTDKQKRQAEHIEKGYEKRGVSKPEAEERAWRTVNKATGGAKKAGGSGVKKTAARKSARSDSAKRAVATRKQQRSTLRQKGDRK